MHILQKLEEMGIERDDLILGDFDQIGEYTARKKRDNQSENYRSAGSFFRPNYERGILIYHLVRTYEIESILEIGFGRGYSTFCAAKAMCDHGIDGTITTVDINFDKNFLEGLTKVFPRMWFEKIEFIQSDSNSYFTKLDDNKSFDLIYIDGDHKYESVKSDWENSKNRFKKYILFDDYHLPTKKQKDIECAKVIDDIDNENKELIIMDRRIFLDDRQLSDDEIDYGQVLIKNDFELNFKNV